MKTICIWVLLFVSCNVASAQRYDAISCGMEFSMVHRQDSTVWGWGFNGNGQLGQGNGDAAPVPVRVPGKWLQVACGSFHSLAISHDGTLWAAGLNTSGQLGVLSGDASILQMTQMSPSVQFVAIAAGMAHSLAISSDRTLWGTGYNIGGQVGNASTEDVRQLVQVDTSSWFSISAGGYHSVGIKSDGTLWAWGDNTVNQLGLAVSSADIPTQVGEDSNWVAVSAGFQYTVALKNDGTIWSWGFNGNGQLGRSGTGTDIQQIGSSNRWRVIAAGASYCFAISDDGTLWGWGFNGNGQLGIPASNSVAEPTQVGNDHNWQFISGASGAMVSSTVYGTHSAGIRSSMQYICTAGSNYVGQLGNGGTSPTPQPVFDCGVTTSVSSEREANLITTIIPSPNPTEDEVHVTLPEVLTTAYVTVMDACGRTMHQQTEMYTDNISIRTASLLSGSYMIHITSPRGGVHVAWFTKL